MKLTGNEIISVSTVFNNLATKEVDLNTACVIAKNLRELAEPRQIIDTKRNEIAEKHVLKNEDGSIQQSKDGKIVWDNYEQFCKETDELLSSEVEDIDIRQISKAALSDVKLSAMDILVLEDAKLFTEENEG